MDRKHDYFKFFPTLIFLLLVGCSSKPIREGVSAPQTKAAPSVFYNPRMSRSRSLASDPSKKTVCSITINSDDEIKLFEKSLNPADFNFVEFVPPQKGDDEAWFKKALQSGVKCDMLVISGHFGGRFMGQRGYGLSLEEMERASCGPDAKGVLDHPKEVFLFGCNTLADKNPPGRTQRQYYDVLVNEEHMAPVVAEQVAAFLYSPIGSSFKGRMRRVFAGVPHIYGFDNRAPLGKNTTSFLEAYLARTKNNYSSLLLSRQPNQENKILIESFRPKSSSTALIQVSGDTADRSTTPVCYLTSEKVPRIEKLNWIDRSLNAGLSTSPSAKKSNMVLENILTILDFFDGIPKPISWTSQEQEVIDRIRNNQAAKKHIMDFLNLNAGSDRGVYDVLLSVRIEIAQLAQKFNWIDAEETKQLITRILNLDHLLASGIRQDDIDRICSNLDSSIKIDIPVSAEFMRKSSYSHLVRCMSRQLTLETKLKLIDVIGRKENFDSSMSEERNFLISSLFPKTKHFLDVLDSIFNDESQDKDALKIDKRMISKFDFGPLTLTAFQSVKELTNAFSSLKKEHLSAQTQESLQRELFIQTDPLNQIPSEVLEALVVSGFKLNPGTVWTREQLLRDETWALLLEMRHFKGSSVKALIEITTDSSVPLDVRLLRMAAFSLVEPTPELFETVVSFFQKNRDQFASKELTMPFFRVEGMTFVPAFREWLEARSDADSKDILRYVDETLSKQKLN